MVKAMWRFNLWFAVLLSGPMLHGQEQLPLKERVSRYLIDLIRLDTTNPPGNETKVAQYLKRVADIYGIQSELLGPDPTRLNFIARLKGGGAGKPLLLMAHSDVVPADRTQWSVAPFAALVRDGVIYGRGAEDVKSLLAAELAVVTELQQKHERLSRDIVLLSESDEEAGSTGITWLVNNAFSKIDADYGLNEFGYYLELPSGQRIYHIQTTEKAPTRIRLTARGVAGHGSLPRDDNPVAHLARAISKLTDAGQPVALNATTRSYLRTMAQLPGYEWLGPLLPALENPGRAAPAADEIRKRDAELGAILRTTVSPTMLQAGLKINVIPNIAEAQLDVRRLPTETKEEIYDRFRKIVDDPAIRIESAGGQENPATEPSSVTSPLYVAMQKVFTDSKPGALTVPFMMRGGTDGAYLRVKGMAVYGVPLFRKEGEFRWHGNDERISIGNLQEGTELLLKIVMAVAK